MCLGIPMQVIQLDGRTARCNAGGIEREISLPMSQGEPVIPGDHGLQKLASDDARATWALPAEMLAVDVGHA
ncbi:MAG: HypC/HybG/HupF family hydrogenase formation chaperone [Gammaproteobacteria bacterium]|nr:HypC/HybG/HupF family hydrogenase formation chaperone [Gammaproteobacteria bacterium]